jgi:hypothetical protein
MIVNIGWLREDQAQAVRNAWGQQTFVEPIPPLEALHPPQRPKQRGERGSDPVTNRNSQVSDPIQYKVNMHDGMCDAMRCGETPDPPVLSTFQTYCFRVVVRPQSDKRTVERHSEGHTQTHEPHHDGRGEEEGDDEVDHVGRRGRRGLRDARGVGMSLDDGEGECECERSRHSRRG